MAKYKIWKRRRESEVIALIEGERMGISKRGRKRTVWVDNIRDWPGGMSMA